MLDVQPGKAYSVAAQLVHTVLLVPVARVLNGHLNAFHVEENDSSSACRVCAHIEKGSNHAPYVVHDELPSFAEIEPSGQALHVSAARVAPNASITYSAPPHPVAPSSRQGGVSQTAHAVQQHKPAAQHGRRRWRPSSPCCTPTGNRGCLKKEKPHAYGHKPTV